MNTTTHTLTTITIKIRWYDGAPLEKRPCLAPVAATRADCPKRPHKLDVKTITLRLGPPTKFSITTHIVESHCMSYAGLQSLVLAHCVKTQIPDTL